MVMWKKALVLVVASLVVALPVITQVAMARPLILGVFPTKEAAEQALGTSSVASPSSVVLPQGKELGDKELAQTDGEFAPFLIIATACWAALGAGGGYYVASILERAPLVVRSLAVAGVAAAAAAGAEATNEWYRGRQNSKTSTSHDQKDSQGFYPSNPTAVQHQSYTAWGNPNPLPDPSCYLPLPRP